MEISWGLTQPVVRELRGEIALIWWIKIGHSLRDQLVSRAYVRITDGPKGP